MITETCVIHPRLLLGAGRAGAAGSTVEAARRPRSSPELGAWAPRARQGLRDLAQRDQGARVVLTVLWIEGKAIAVCSATRIGGGGERSSRLGSREGCAGLLDA